MFKRRAYSTMLTYKITDQEKEIAEKALLWFEFCQKKLKEADDYLNLMYEPFKNGGEVSPEKIFKSRAALRRFRDKAIDNFNLFKKISFKCYAKMQPFMSDTQTDKILQSFVMAIEDVEKQVNRFAELFSNIKSKDFIQNIITAIDNIKKEIAELDQIIDDRVKNHIRTHILARNWIDNISQELQEKVEKKSPLITELVEEREKKLKGIS